MAGKAVLGAFVVNRVQKEYPNVLSQKGKSCPLSLRAGRVTAPAAPALQASLTIGCWLLAVKIDCLGMSTSANKRLLKITSAL